MAKQLSKSGKSSQVDLRTLQGAKLVRDDPDVIAAKLKETINSSGIKSVEVLRRDHRKLGLLSPAYQKKKIQDKIVSTLSEIEDSDVRLDVFNGVAAAFGYATTPSPGHNAERVAEGKAATPEALPEVAPQLYRQRPDAKESAEGFLRRVYEPWLSAGCLFQFHIGKLDPSLLQGLKNQFKGRAEELRAVLPTKKDAVSQRLAALVGKEIDDPTQRRRLAQAERSLIHAMAKLNL